MGFSSHSVENLGEPFLSVDEMVFCIPKSSNLTITKDQFKLLFILKGEIQHDLDGEAPVSTLRKGDILLCPGFRQHRFINADASRSCQLHLLRLFMDGDAIRNCAKKRSRSAAEENITDFVYHHLNRTMQFGGGIDSDITHTLNTLRKECEQRGIGYQHRVRSLCTDLVILVARKLKGGSSSMGSISEGGTGQLVASSKEYILKNLERSELTLGEIAWYIGKGEEHFARVFKRETGQSVFDYVRRMRVNQAKTYLRDSLLSMTRIAELCGFSSQSFFSRTFSELVGLSPSAYRKTLETKMMPYQRDTSLAK